MSLGAVIIGSIFFLFLIFIASAIYKEKQRKKSIMHLSHSMGTEFLDTAQFIWTKEFRIMSKGRNRKISNCINGKEQMFDYSFVTGAGKSQQTHLHTMVHIELDKRLPQFNLSTEHFFHKLGALVGFKDVNFDTHPEFSKRYYLKSKDPNIRSAFNSEVLHFFETKNFKGVIEANGKHLLVYWSRLKVHQMKSRLELAKEIARLWR